MNEICRECNSIRFSIRPGVYKTSDNSLVKFPASKSKKSVEISSYESNGLTHYRVQAGIKGPFSKEEIPHDWKAAFEKFGYYRIISLHAIARLGIDWKSGQ